MLHDEIQRLITEYAWLPTETPNGGKRRKRGQVGKVKLRQILVEHFDEEELKDLCFEMEEDYDSLPVQGKNGKARELVVRCERTGQLTKLVKMCRRLRPNAFEKSRSPGVGLAPMIIVIASPEAAALVATILKLFSRFRNR
jgi:hypothetical protein